MKKKVNYLCLFILFLLILTNSLSVFAATPIEKTLSYDGVTGYANENSWTTDRGVKEINQYEEGTRVTLTTTKTIRNLNTGEHYYKTLKDEATIGYWEVFHKPAQCIHDTNHMNYAKYYGFTVKNYDCHKFYNSGWLAFCVDCGERFEFLVYANKNTISNIKTMPASGHYVFLCPWCDGVEQAISYEHYCNAISNNRYKIKYHRNNPSDATVGGYMAETKHMYNNATIYDGKATNYTDTNLRKNSFSCIGYTFKGWNTKPDGTGTSYTDGQAVKNLVTTNNGSITLYAQWTKNSSTLKIDAKGGKYNNQSIASITQQYQTTYTLNSNVVTAPTGYKITFDENGGTACTDITTSKEFAGWSYGTLNGIMSGNVYTFNGSNGTSDTISINYKNKSFKLPSTSKTGSRFIGWYYDANFTTLAGFANDYLTVSQNTTLYARFANLTLTATDDYVANNKKGAVDLSWAQADNKSTIFKVYQSTDNSNWSLITDSTHTQNVSAVNKNLDANGSVTINANGFYTITINGAAGGDYGSNKGGKGGYVKATYWLKKGDVLYFYPGTSGSGKTPGKNTSYPDYNGGTGNDSGSSGGAASLVILYRNSQSTTLMIAGGGGGANANYAGGDGGTGGGNSTSIGVNGTGAGGGGYSGGKAGAYVLHTHTTACNHHTHGDSCYITHVCSSSCSNPCKYAHQHTAKPSGSGSDGQRIGCYVYNNVKYHVCSTCNNAYGFYDDATGQHCNNCKNTTVKWYDGWDWRISCNTTSEKELICTLTEGYQCGKTESSVDSYAQSEGGTNYIYNGNNCSNTVSSTHSIAENGKFNITSGLIGFQESVFSFNDVPAADKVAPNLMSAAKIESLSETKRRITLTPPSDRGSTYYHKVESFVISSGKIDTNSKLTSNITTNVLTTGVAKYYYRIDTNSTGNVTTSDKTTTSTTLEYTLTGTSTYYIHFAAMDVAGNLGATQHTKIGKLSDPPPPPPQNDYTNEINTKLLFVEETETGSLYKADSKNYYVRADGKTEYIIPITAELKEKAINEYMIDKIRLSVNSPGKEWSEIIVPRTSISTATTEFSNDDVSINQSKETLTYLNITSSTATRNNYCKSLTINPTFTVSAAHSGKTITVYPTAYVNYSGLKQSNSTTDGNNAINIIADGTAPNITGLDALNDLININLTNNSKLVNINVSDTWSGFKAMEVTIRNNDNFFEKSDYINTSSMNINIIKSNYLFCGDFTITVKAWDRVGNVSTVSKSSNAFTLSADMSRVRPPVDGSFKVGDGATLTTKTSGYVDKVVIEFPSELSSLNKTYTYSTPLAFTEENYLFNIPFGTPEKTYQVKITAYKGTEKLETYQLISIVEGNILDEFRTTIQG